MPLRADKVALQEFAEALEQLTLPWWGIVIDDGIRLERYGLLTFATSEKATEVCEALQEAYNRHLWDVGFAVKFRGKLI